jgi:hypothetical protein
LVPWELADQKWENTGVVPAPAVLVRVQTAGEHGVLAGGEDSGAVEEATGLGAEVALGEMGEK